MKSKILYVILTTAALLGGLASCVKDDLYGAEEPFGRGESTVELNVTFRPLASPALGATRSEKGDLIGAIEELFVVWYRADSTCAGTGYFTKEQLTITNPKRPIDPQQPETEQETTTQHATFRCRIPYGKYRIYAVANTGDLTDDGRIASESDFKSIVLTWKSDRIAANAQMSGYFSKSEETAYARGEAELVAIDRPEVTLHSWMRRAASKVTVSFDASALNENIYIYLQSAQIRDIPKTCTLVADNRPTSQEQLIDGDTLLFGAGTDYEKWPRIACGRGANTYGTHDNDAPSLFFYENMQGIHPDKHKYQNFESKDNVLCGTYLEVTGYYVNSSADRPSYGKIIYRCMLGRNMIDDFNAERNTHYKVTLVFKHDANDPDWHIEYDYVPKPPEIVVPDPMYISYLSNKELTVPVTVYYDKNITSVKELKAEIVRNDWGYYDHKYNSTNPQLENGFLSLDLINKTAISDRFTEYTGTKTFTTPAYQTDEYCHFEVPVYTRPMDLLKGFSGNNYYVGRRRYARVKLTAVLTTGDPVEQTIDVIQVRRLVNPKGIWRKGESMKPFRVTLMNTNSNPTIATEFDEVTSEGPWTATILDGGDWIQIKDTEESDWGTGPVTGGTGSKVEFDYRPGSTYADGARFGRIEIKFHNNTCSHIILVSQGIGTVPMGGRKWHMTNVKWAGQDESNPLLEGSMFKFGCSTQAILSSNNIKEGYGFQQQAFWNSFDVYDTQGNVSSAVFKNIPTDPAGFTDAAMLSDGKSRVAEYEDWMDLTNVDKYVRYYGVCYGEECGETLDKNSETNTYSQEGQVRGMRGCFVCDDKTGAHLFFPVGNTGYGRRQYKDDEGRHTSPLRYGVLKYANRTDEMPYATAINVPCLYELYQEPGAVYWYGKRAPNTHWGFDINYMTFGFESYTTQHVFVTDADGLNGESYYPVEDQSLLQSDACFLRRIDN